MTKKLEGKIAVITGLLHESFGIVVHTQDGPGRRRGDKMLLAPPDNFRFADDTFRNSHAAVRTDLVLVYSRRTKSSIAWLTSWARSCWVQ